MFYRMVDPYIFANKMN